MQAWVITLRGHPYSEACSLRCRESTDIDVQVFDAVPASEAVSVMQQHGLKWTWANHNTSVTHCPQTGLRQHPYGRLEPKIGCSMSHYLLWLQCAEGDESYLILEHDAVFVRPWQPVEYYGICQVNDPRGATPHGNWWSDCMAERGPGVWPKTRIEYGNGRPDGLAGNSAYLLKPWAAADLVAAVQTYGVWPNDAIMCRQLFPYLEELYPFLTQVAQTVSTSS